MPKSHGWENMQLNGKIYTSNYIDSIIQNLIEIKLHEWQKIFFTTEKSFPISEYKTCSSLKDNIIPLKKTVDNLLIMLCKDSLKFNWSIMTEIRKSM